MALGSRIHLLFKHAFIHRAHRKLRTSKHFGPNFSRMAESKFTHSSARGTTDPLSTKSNFIAVFLLTPFFSAVSIADGHSHDPNRRMNTGDRTNSRNTAPCPNDD